ncbi:hypothetical protein H696_02793 [Fonticula alba]|uniref:Spastin/Vps4 C-terminal domain-containing protein n=1 Tax=Fonticula alba TaxID=691883 RepID=A0A058Z8M0_FONAL|nr:hypothetical protein H696_02793 [Fonticula alba]KCV70451.1 hypothetical protein H696_02793 [Fonticula alba]|eukprot:XP_009494967.1 hypothetical protein H696_02793 [Fonticula alba]
MNSVRELVRGLTVDEMRTMSMENCIKPTTASDFEKAIDRTSPSVCAADIAKYEAWMEEFGSF